MSTIQNNSLMLGFLERTNQNNSTVVHVFTFWASLKAA